MEFISRKGQLRVLCWGRQQVLWRQRGGDQAFVGFLIYAWTAQVMKDRFVCFIIYRREIKKNDKINGSYKSVSGLYHRPFSIKQCFVFWHTRTFCLKLYETMKLRAKPYVPVLSEDKRCLNWRLWVNNHLSCFKYTSTHAPSKWIWRMNTAGNQRPHLECFLFMDSRSVVSNCY